ncbi:MAG: hypothetical protein ACK5V3_10755 [Bdellovibrionales bacterium]
MSKNNKNVPAWALTGHKKPTTRREFLGYGMIPFAASTFMPNLMQVLSPQVAGAQAGCPAGGSSLIPFIQLNLSGGAGLMGNFLPHDLNRNPLASDSIMGFGAGGTGTPIVREFGNVPFAGNRGDGTIASQILLGIQERAMQATRDKTAFVAMCVRSRDDSSENPFAMNGLAHRAGLVGTVLPHLGTDDSQTGISQMPVLYAPPAPLVVRGFSAVANALSYTASLNTALNPTQKERLTKLISDLNGSQARKLASINSGPAVQQVIDCAGIKNIDLIRAGSGQVDPRANATVAGIWGINATSANNSMNLVFSTMVFNTLNGQAGSCSLNMGGYDYHGNPRDNGTIAPDISSIGNESTNSRDRRVGRVIGNILQTAEAMGRPLFLYVTSDGSVSSDDSMTNRQSNFISDRGSAGTAFLIMYRPQAMGGRVATTDFQIGHYDRLRNGVIESTQAADDTTIVGGSPELATQAAFANYCKFNNRMDLYNLVVTRGLVETDRLNQVVKVG